MELVKKLENLYYCENGRKNKKLCITTATAPAAARSMSLS